MPFPKLSNGRVDPQLTNVALAYTNGAYIAEEILPTVPGLKEEAGKIAQMGNLLSSPTKIVSDSGISAHSTSKESLNNEFHHVE
jgi:hypothetical protein